MKQQTSATTETCTKGRTVVDFSGKTIYVGIDVHQKDYQVAKIIDGICLCNHRMGAGSKALINHLKSYYPGAFFKCVYESCAWGFTLQRILEQAGKENSYKGILSNARIPCPAKITGVNEMICYQNLLQVFKAFITDLCFHS